MLVKTLTKVGNSHAIVLDKAVLDLLHIDSDTPLHITTDGNQLMITPVAGKKSGLSAVQAFDKINKKYKRVFKNLA